jgi:hypothetical protein
LNRWAILRMQARTAHNQTTKRRLMIAQMLYSSLITDLPNEVNLREGTQGVPRSTYCFRHTYAMLRLQECVWMHQAGFGA